MPRTFKELTELIVGLRQAAEGIRKHVGEAWNPDVTVADDYDAKALELEMMIPLIIDLENKRTLKAKELEGYLEAVLEGIDLLRGFVEMKCISTGEVPVDVCERYNIPMKIKNPTQGEIIIMGRTLMTTFPDMVGTDYEPSVAIQTIFNTNTPAAETAQEEGRNMDAELTNLTQEKDLKSAGAVDLRELLRNSLTRTLPEKRYDKRLDDYGFNVWDEPGSGESGGTEPGPESWEAAPTNFVVVEGVAGSALLTADVHADAEGCAVFMAEKELGETTPPALPGEPIAALITPIEPGKFSFNLNITPNRRVWFWICHVKEGAWGAMAGPEWIEVIK